MKAIIFDIDGVIIKSNSAKKEITKKILKKHNLYDIPGVKKILSRGLNRKVNIELIYELQQFDKEKVLEDINYENSIIESNPIENEKVVNFIKNNFEKYIFCTNTAMPSLSGNRVIEALGISGFFNDILGYEDGDKVENVKYILDKYNLSPKDVLFIDDNINHIEKVKVTGVNTLYFTDYNIDLEEEIEKINF
ncbi:MAG: HAD family hydrolase [Candidatus Gracilibacteria bacterium]|nr:HAD family hydrolase [Candidatus Gracilibacteria bacterium]